jgi:hypothetical protein
MKTETQVTIPTEYVESLRIKINPCKEEADRIVNEWLDENNLVEIEPEPILTND